MRDVVLEFDHDNIFQKDKIVSSVPIHYVGEEYINRRGTVLQKEKELWKILKL